MNIVAHNLTAMNAQRQFGINYKGKTKSSEKLSSGYRINRAADDAAGLSISEGMRRQVRGLTQGVKNAQDGISMCQVADGALVEVNEMLHRITELSIEAANGTNNEQQRQYIQDEIHQLLLEIDRIGKDTRFNDRPVFRGTDEVVKNPDGSDFIQGDIPFGDFMITDVDLGKTPLQDGRRPDDIYLQAIVSNPNSAADGHVYSLVYGDGSTTSSSVRLTDAAGNKTVVRMSDMTVGNFTSNGVDEWSRELTYSPENSTTSVTITQRIRTEDTSADEKNYVISYDFSTSADIADMEFMFHVDTAYNNDDYCEGYFIDGNRVEQYCIYSEASSGLTAGVTSSNVHASVPDSLSIVDTERALAFSEKISFPGGKPDSLSIGHYSEIDDWPYYDNLNSHLGESAYNKDLGFSLYYGHLSTGSTVTFNYGIANVDHDDNLAGVPVHKDDSVLKTHSDKLELWIHYGCGQDEGMYLEIDSMDTAILGIRDIDVSTTAGAKRALDSVKGALEGVIANRAKVGAQQNRMESAVRYQDNLIENTMDAESRIRDTDMAKEMLRYANSNILEQVGHAMMSQANRSNEGVLSLLQ